MTRRFPLLSSILAAIAALAATPVAAQQTVTVIEEEWIDGEWVVVEHIQYSGESPSVSPSVDFTNSASRAAVSPMETAEAAAIAAYGPFRVIDERTAAIVDVTDGASPRQFADMINAHPQIKVLEFVDVPGTHDDRANLAVGRMIRAHGIATRAPEGGSIRSGGVELFLAGTELEIHQDSEFAVHGWLDYRGLGAEDYPMSAPEHQRYLNYYAEMGMNAEDARAFYAMTNSVPFENALWLTGEEMQVWMAVDMPAETAIETANEAAPKIEAEPVLPRLAYLDLGAAFQ